MHQAASRIPAHAAVAATITPGNIVANRSDAIPPIVEVLLHELHAQQQNDWSPVEQPMEYLQEHVRYILQIQYRVGIRS